MNNSGLVISAIDVDKYPYIKQHLDLYYDKLAKRYDKGHTPYNLRNCAFLPDLSKKKIVWKALGTIPEFTIVEENLVINDKGNFLVTDDEVNLKYLCGYLNSKIFFWQFKNIGISMGSGYEFKVAYVKDIEVIDLDFENKSKISILVDEIIDYRKKGEDLKAEKLESIINDIIYKAYGLNEEEQLIIEEYNL